MSNSITITTTELLDFLVKAQKVSSHVDVEKTNVGYKININCDWYANGDFSTQATFITEEGTSVWNNGSDYDFYTMNGVLDDLVKEAKEREMKRQKRQELLSRLTKEEKELLGVK